MADTFTVLGRVVLTRDPGQGPDREPRCRVHIGFDVAFHKVQREACLSWGWSLPGQVPIHRPKRTGSGVFVLYRAANIATDDQCCAVPLCSHKLRL